MSAFVEIRGEATIEKKPMVRFNSSEQGFMQHLIIRCGVAVDEQFSLKWLLKLNVSFQHNNRKATIPYTFRVAVEFRLLITAGNNFPKVS